MLGKIPRRLTAPFGLLGDEAKLTFSTQPGGVAKLATVRNISENDDYWDQYFVLFDSPSDVFSLITPHHIRRALLDAPENITTLIRVLTSRLFNLIVDHTFPSSTNDSVSAFASSFMKTGTSSGRNTTKEVLNCLRILQRLLPVVFEVEGESTAFELGVLWKKPGFEAGIDARSSETPQFVIDDDEDSDSEGRVPEPASSAKPGHNKALPTLGEKLFSAIIDLLFCCGFTLPTKIQVDHYKINYVIWEKGVGSTTDLGPNHAYDNNKTEVLRLLLVLLSRQIYIPSGSMFSNPSLYSLHLVQKTPRRDVLTILCSLLNTAMNSPPSNDSIGGMAGSMAGKLPYNHLVFKSEDPRSNLVGMCLQVLCVLLDFQGGQARDAVIDPGINQGYAPTAHTNAFRYFLAKLHRVQDFEFIIKGLLGIMEQQMASVNNLLPGARKSTPYMHETIIFFWKMIELNKKFCTYVLQSDKSLDFVVHLLCYALEIKDKPQQHGLCRALSYIIQSLSAEPTFGPKLTGPIKVQLPAKWNFAGTAGDYMINAIYAMVATAPGHLNFLYPALIISLANSAPHFKNITVASSTRLVQLFASFSSPLFLLADEGHPRLLFFMLDIFNSVILHHLSENPNLIYGILSAHKVFEDLGTFTLSRGLREINRVQLAKEEQMRKPDSNPKGRDSAAFSESADPGAEKSRLLERESGASDTQIGSAENIVRYSEEGRDIELGVVTESYMSPSSESPLHGSISGASSEKARGKMKERRSLSLETNSSFDRVAAAGAGRNGFVPTQEWVTSWHQGLPLDPVMLLISELLPKVQELQASRHKTTSTSAIVDFLSTVSLEHILPETPAPTSRRFLWSNASIVWLTSLIWGEIYVRGMTPLGIWNATNVRLFYVKHEHIQSRQITETVSNVVGGFLRRNTDSTPHSR